MPSLDIAYTWDGQPIRPAPRVDIRREDDSLVVRIRSPLYGAAPVEGPPSRRWRLWEHEVVEVFLAGPDAANGVEYIELELAPTGHWLALRLRGTRNIIDDNLPVFASSLVGETTWTGTLRLSLHDLPPGPLRVLAAAAHGPPDDRRYLAHVPLPATSPDFHQLHRFTPIVLEAGVHGPADSTAAESSREG